MVLRMYLQFPMRFIVLISKYNVSGVFYGRDEPYFLHMAYSAGAGDRHRNQAYLPGTGDTVMT